MKTTSKARKKKAAPEPRMSNIQKPPRLTLEGWQLALRQQQATKEPLAVEEVDAENAPGLYLVRNPISRNRYEVRYYGAGHPLNRCACMDFRTSRLGSCKHLEAVRLWIGASRKRKVHGPDMRQTWLYVDYNSVHSLRISYGTEDRHLLEPLFAPLFKRDGTLSVTGTWRLMDAVRMAMNTSSFFHCSDDALALAAAGSDRHRRLRKLEAVFKQDRWWEGVFCKGIRPYPYQAEGIRFAARAGRCILADEMGLGKTIQAIGTAALYLREGLVNSVLVICPTSLKYQWKREIQRFVGEDATVVEGNPSIRKGLYAAVDTHFKIVSYNAVKNDVRILGGLHFDMVIMDEVQRLKNWDTQIARSARKITSDYAVILSGTPLENKLEELYSIVQLVDQFLLGPYYLFRHEHIEMSPSGKALGYKGLNAIGKQLEPVLLRRRKADVALQLPGRMDKNLFVPMTEQQAGIHAEYADMVARIVHKWQTTHYLSETDRRRLLTGLSMMRMVCDSTFILDQQTRYDTKVEETMNILESIFSSGQDKVVIFSGWERMTRLIAAELDARGIAYSNLHGGVPSGKRKDLIDRFTDNPQVRVFLSTDAGATGLNLQAASYVINLDLPWNPAVLEQRIGRIYRIGQQKRIQVINLVAIGTIEERMLQKLKFKTDLFDGVLNGGEDEVFLNNNKLETLVTDLGLDKESFSAPLQQTAQEDAEVEGRVSDAALEPVPDEDAQEEEQPVVRPSGGDSELTADALIGQGVSFLGNLLQTLKEPEASRRLVDTLVREDPATGQASINIPVSGKESVLQFVSLLGKLLK